MKVLVVDVDGTVVRTDLLWESIWAALSSAPSSCWAALQALPAGRAGIKRALAPSLLDRIETIPLNPTVVAYMADWRAAGGRVVLATASDQRLAEAIAARLGGVDEVHGSDGRRNLKGEVKARFLCERFGAQGFAYIGDSRADLAVWAQAASAVTVDATPAMRRAVEQVAPVAEHLGARRRSRMPYLQVMRPHQWLKNLLVFVPLLAGHRFERDTVIQASLAFAAFTCLAAAVYLLNDLLDLAADRVHPRKRARPLAAGAVPIPHATGLAAGLALAGIALATRVGSGVLVILLAYVLLTTAYSVAWKQVAILDIGLLAALYVLRLVGGGLATGIIPSVWLLACSGFLFLSLATVKRLGELVVLGDAPARRQNRRGYTTADLPVLTAIALVAGFLSVLVLALYLTSPAVTILYAHPTLLWGVCVALLYWIARTVLLAQRGALHDDPVRYAIQDPVSLLTMAFAAACVLLATGP